MTEIDFYVYGLLIGDSIILKKNNKKFVFFSNVHKEISDIVSEYCKRKGYKYSAYERPPQEENWSILYVVEIASQNLFDCMRELKLLKEDYTYHLIYNPHLIRGLFETSATFFEFADKRTKRHRIAFSGNEYLLYELKSLIQSFCVCTPIVRRKEREHLGVISKSYRFTVNRRDSKKNLIKWMYPKDCFGSLLYKQKVNYYMDSVLKNPLNVIEEYKNYRTATKAMCKHLDIHASGVRGGFGGGSSDKPINIIQNGIQLKICNGWKEAYQYIKLIYEEVTVLDAPKINFNKKR